MIHVVNASPVTSQPYGGERKDELEPSAKAAVGHPEHFQCYMRADNVYLTHLGSIQHTVYHIPSYVQLFPAVQRHYCARMAKHVIISRTRPLMRTTQGMISIRRDYVMYHFIASPKVHTVPASPRQLIITSASPLAARLFVMSLADCMGLARLSLK